MADVTAATITVNVKTNAGTATSDLKSLDRQIDKTGASTKGLEKSTSKSSASLARFGQVAKVAAVAGFAILVAGLKKSVDAASDLEEATGKFNVVFKNVQSEADAMADNLNKNFGMSKRAALDMLSGTGDLLTGLGFTADEALKLSDEVARLGTDLASFSNYAGGAEGAAEALTKGLLGEREMMKGLGISINETDIKQRALADGLPLLNGQLSKTDKAALTLKMAMEQSKNALGDFARTSDSFANTWRTLQSSFEDTAAEVGQQLLPSMSGLTVSMSTAMASGGGLKKILAGVGEVASKLVDTLALAVDAFSLLASQVSSDMDTEELESIIERQDEIYESMQKLADAGQSSSQAFKDLVAESKKLERAGSELGESLIATADSMVLQAENAKVNWSRLMGVSEEDITEANDNMKTATGDAITRVKESQDALSELQSEADASEVEKKKAQKEKLAAIEESYWNKIARYTQMGADLANEGLGIYGAYSDLRQNQMEAEIMKMEERGASEEELAKKRKELARQAAIDQKRMGIFSAILDTATGVTKALASTPPPYSYVLAALTATKGAVQVAAIRAQPIPAAQMGGQFTVPPGNEADSGLLRVNSGENVTVEPVRESNSGTGSKSVNISIDGASFKGWMINEVNRALNAGEIQIRRSGAIKITQ